MELRFQIQMCYYSTWRAYCFQYFHICIFVCIQATLYRVSWDL